MKITHKPILSFAEFLLNLTRNAHFDALQHGTQNIPPRPTFKIELQPVSELTEEQRLQRYAPKITITMTMEGDPT